MSISSGAETAFMVEVQCREAGRMGARMEPQRYRFRISAPTAELAALSALDEFRRTTTLQSVGWVREVVCCDAQSSSFPSRS